MIREFEKASVSAFFSARALSQVGRVLLTTLFLLSALLFGFFAARATFHLKWAARLPQLPAGATLPRVRCSVVIAARNEGERLSRTMEHILAQTGVDLELIVVDDRSTDRTPEVLRQFVEGDPRVKILRVDVLPENWLGKCHACHVASKQVSGDWILFTDADCWLKPGVLARALAVGEREQVQHVTLTPGVAALTVSARACHIAFLLSCVDWFARVNQDVPEGHLGIGAFNLVRTETYRKFGGHETLRLTVVDDVKLGLLVRRAGGRTRAFIGSDDAECHWGVTVPHFFKIMEKNYFAALDYRISHAVVVGILLPILWAVSLFGMFTGTFEGRAAAGALFAIIVPALVIARRVRWPFYCALVTPFIFPVLYFAILNSMWRTLRQGGIRWRETFYPLATLRAGNVS